MESRMERQMKIKATIKRDKYGEGLWLVINPYSNEIVEDSVAWAINEGEVEAIRDACEEWLEIESQEIMKESMPKYKPMCSD